MTTPSLHRASLAGRLSCSRAVPRGSGRLRPALAAALLALGLGGPALAATGPMDFLYTAGHPPAAETRGPQQKVWKLAEFSAVRLVPAEAGAVAGQLPVTVPPDRLRALLASAELQFGPDKTEPLFGRDELDEVVPGLSKALAAAGPGEDLLLLSTARRGSGFLLTPLSITARLFVQDGRLQFIVREVRRDAYSEHRMARMVPDFAFGSRAQAASGVRLRSTDTAATVVRTDWLSWPLQAAAPMAAPAAMPAAAPGLPAPPPRGEAVYDEAAQRLRGLQKLRDAGLISEEEFQRKRREILERL